MTPPAISSSPALSTNLTCVHPEQSACTLYVAEMFACAFAGAFESDEAKKKLTCDNNLWQIEKKNSLDLWRAAGVGFPIVLVPVDPTLHVANIFGIFLFNSRRGSRQPGSSNVACSVRGRVELNFKPLLQLRNLVRLTYPIIVSPPLSFSLFPPTSSCTCRP